MLAPIRLAIVGARRAMIVALIEGGGLGLSIGPGAFEHAVEVLLTVLLKIAVGGARADHGGADFLPHRRRPRRNGHAAVRGCGWLY